MAGSQARLPQLLILWNLGPMAGEMLPPARSKQKLVALTAPRAGVPVPQAHRVTQLHIQAEGFVNLWASPLVEPQGLPTYAAGFTSLANMPPRP